MNAVEILRQLVAIASPSTVSNTAVIDFAAGLLEAHGWHTQRLAYTAPDGAIKQNLIAVPMHHRNGLPSVDLAFFCHTDTVPYADSWATALELTEREGCLHACGSCDVKGSLACLLAAALALDAAKLERPVALILTADEEVGCLGARNVVDSGIIRPTRAVICEPTSLHPATAGKGYGLAEVRITGREAHSAFPAKGVSALTAAARMLLAIEQLPEESSDSLFDPPYTTYNVGTLHGGTAKNIIPGTCTFLVEWRSLPSERSAAGGERVQRLAAELAAQSPGISIEVIILRADAGFACLATSTLGVALSGLLGREPTGISFGSEATRFAQIAEEVVVIGPGDMHTAHSDRECVPLVELEQWVAAVQVLLQNPSYNR